jgi:hypothetical protein
MPTLVTLSQMLSENEKTLVLRGINQQDGRHKNSGQGSGRSAARGISVFQ